MIHVFAGVSHSSLPTMLSLSTFHGGKKNFFEYSKSLHQGQSKIQTYFSPNLRPPYNIYPPAEEDDDSQNIQILLLSWDKNPGLYRPTANCTLPSDILRFLDVSLWLS